MPQLMPILWISSTILMILLMMVLVILYNYCVMKVMIYKVKSSINSLMYLW